MHIENSPQETQRVNANPNATARLKRLDLWSTPSFALLAHSYVFSRAVRLGPNRLPVKWSD